MIRHLTSATLCAFALLCSPATLAQEVALATTPRNPTLYQRLGSEEGLKHILDGSLNRMVHNPEVNQAFAQVNLEKLAKRDYIFYCALTGGGCTYGGDDMKTVHTGMHLGVKEVDALFAALRASMQENRVGEREAGELIALLEPFRQQVLNR
jgi:hemoglobin